MFTCICGCSQKIIIFEKVGESSEISLHNMISLLDYISLFVRDEWVAIQSFDRKVAPIGSYPILLRHVDRQ